MTSQTVTKQFQCTYCPIPQSKDNQAIKCFSLKINQKQAERLVLDLFFFCFLKKLYSINGFVIPREFLVKSET